ncbi:MAG: hypothetical protein IIZ59_00390, partial [Clostridia bacterium]|nr:hypothetical protein [Clostridia bacterium]
MLGRFSKCLSAIFAVGIIASNIPAHTVYAQDDTPDFSYIGAASSFSAEQTAEMARTVYKGLKEHKDTIKLQVDGVSMVIEPNHEAAAGICREVAQNYDVGLMTNAVSINYKLCSYGSESYIEYTPNYVVEDAYYNTAYAKAMSVLDDITAMVDMGWSDYEKALFLHDYLAAYCDYDHDLEKYTAYDMVTTKDAVCDGYSALYSMLMNRVGVRTTKVISRTLNHAWNLVDIEGELYHVDVTFDDSFHYGHPGLVSHDFFLKTNDEMNGSRHEADDYQFLYGKSVYDSVSVSPVIGFWENTSCAISPIVINGDSSDVMWAVISDDGVNSVAVNLCDMDSIGDDDIDYIGLYAQNSIWNVPGSRSYYPGNHSAALVRDNVLFYTTSDEIYGLYNGKAVSLYKLTDEQKQAGRLYGLFEKDGDLYYYVSPAYAPDSAHGTAYATSKEYRLSGYTVERFVEYVKNQTGESTVTIATYGDNTVQEVCAVYSNYSLPTTPTRDGFLFKELYYDEALTAGNEVGDVLLTHDEMFYADWYRCGMAGAKGSIFDNFNLSLYMAYDDALMYGSGNYLKMRVNSTSETINFEDIENNKDDNFGGYYFADVQFPPKDMEKLIGIETFIDGVSCGVQ